MRPRGACEIHSIDLRLFTFSSFLSFERVGKRARANSPSRGLANAGHRPALPGHEDHEILEDVHVRVRESADAESAVHERRILPLRYGGIVEVQLPADYKIKNIEATERAKAKMLEKIHGSGDGAVMDHPHSRQAELAASRAALRVEDDGGFQKAEASANLKLRRKEFATSFGRGFGTKAKKPRH